MTYTLELAGHSVFVRSDNAVLAENRLSGRIGIIRKRSRVISPTRNELDQVVTGLRGNILETLKSDPDCRRHLKFQIGKSIVTLSLFNDLERACNRLAEFRGKAVPLLQIADAICDQVQCNLSRSRVFVDIGDLGISADDTLDL